MTAAICVLCDRARALDADDPGWILRTVRWAVSIHPSMPVPGWVAVQTVRHTEGLADLDPAEAAELGPLLSRLSRAVTQVTGSQKVYTYSLGEGCAHTHILVGPPTQKLRGAAFIAALLGRNESLVDPVAADHTALRLVGEMSDQNSQRER
jgi:diadenosine tetraphosphate (Ap4A) HIT family hydrolase